MEVRPGKHRFQKLVVTWYVKPCRAMCSFPNFLTGWARASHLVGATTLKDVSKEKDTFEASNVARLTWATAMTAMQHRVIMA